MKMTPNPIERAPEERILCFSTFELFVARRLLLESGMPVRIGSRALEILIALVSRAGEVVSKRDLIRCAWPGVPDSESNLKVHIAMLRKCLGAREGAEPCIVSVSGQGYSFVAPVRIGTLPASGARLVGRQVVIEFLAAELPRRSLVTIAGPGGVGKSSVGVAVAERISSDYPHGVAYVDLASIEDTNRIPSMLGAALGLAAAADLSLTQLLAALRGKRGLIVLDNCERCIDSTAGLVEELLMRAPGQNILATSREPLRCPGEWSYRLPPLLTPAECSGLTASAALSYTAVELFVACAAGCAAAFELTDRNAAAVGEACCHADGLPLAIELIAAKLHEFTLPEICSALKTAPLLLTQGSDLIPLRQRSLRATLEWSYAALPAREQAIFRRLSMFRVPFSAESAVAVAAGTLVRDTDVLDGLMSLADKSLLTTHINGSDVRYRLFHIARAYAHEKLIASEEYGMVLHAFKMVFGQ